MFFYLEGSPKGTHFSSQDSWVWTPSGCHNSTSLVASAWCLSAPSGEITFLLFFFLLLESFTGGDSLYLDVQLTSSKGRPGSICTGCSEHSTGLLVCLCISYYSPECWLVAIIQNFPIWNQNYVCHRSPSTLYNKRVFPEGSSARHLMRIASQFQRDHHSYSLVSTRETLVSTHLVKSSTIICFSNIVIKHSGQSNLRKEKVYLDYTFWSQSIIPESQDKNSSRIQEAKTEVGTRKERHTVACSQGLPACFLTIHVHLSRQALTTAGWALPTLNIIKKTSHMLACRPVFWRQFLKLKTLDWVKLTSSIMFPH